MEKKFDSKRKPIQKFHTTRPLQKQNESLAPTKKTGQVKMVWKDFFRTFLVCVYWKNFSQVYVW